MSIHSRVAWLLLLQMEEDGEASEVPMMVLLLALVFLWAISTCPPFHHTVAQLHFKRQPHVVVILGPLSLFNTLRKACEIGPLDSTTSARQASRMNFLMRIFMANSDAEGTDRLDKGLMAFIRAFDAFIWPRPRANWHGWCGEGVDFHPARGCTKNEHREHVALVGREACHETTKRPHCVTLLRCSIMTAFRLETCTIISFLPTQMSPQKQQSTP